MIWLFSNVNDVSANFKLFVSVKKKTKEKKNINIEYSLKNITIPKQTGIPPCFAKKILNIFLIKRKESGDSSEIENIQVRKN